MKYHFRLHKEGKGYWAECIEFNGCLTQGDSLEELVQNAHEALNLILDEPAESDIVFPLPDDNVKKSKNVFEVEVEPAIAFAFLMRKLRLEKGLTQHQMKDILEFKSVYAYQKLERSKTANPTLKTLQQLKEKLPDFPMQLLFGMS